MPLAQFLSAWVAAYRYIFHSIAEVILFWWPWPVPPAAKDGLVLWVLMGTTLMRWMISVGLHAKPHTDTLLWRLYTCFYYVYFVLLSCLLGPVLLLIYFAARDPVATFFRLYGNIPKRVYFPAIRLLQGLEEPKFDKRRNAWVLLMMFLATIAACLVLIALNAFFGHPGTIPTG